MAYCAVLDIRAYYIGKKFDATDDNLSETQISGFIDEATARIDAVLRQRYSLPILGTSDLLILKDVCEKLVVCKVDNIIRTRDENGRNICREANDLLADLANGDLALEAGSSGSINLMGGDDEPAGCSEYPSGCGCGIGYENDE